MKRIFLVEDDKKIAQNLSLLLQAEGFHVIHALTQSQAIALLWENKFDLALVDLSLPDGSGFSVCTELKAAMDIPVIFLTASGDEASVVTGLNMGADDYITKPFSLAVLRARVNAQLRRGGAEHSGVVELDGFVFDFQRMEFKKDGRPVELSKTEQKLLYLLVQNRGATLSRGTLVDRLWTDGAEYVDENALSVTVKRLRGKLEEIGKGGCIKTRRGMGYQL